MRGMVPGENKFPSEIAKTERSQGGQKGRQKISRKDAKSQREDEGIKLAQKTQEGDHHR
jgi:hypothetical protein